MGFVKGPFQAKWEAVAEAEATEAGLVGLLRVSLPVPGLFRVDGGMDIDVIGVVQRKLYGYGFKDPGGCLLAGLAFLC